MDDLLSINLPKLEAVEKNKDFLTITSFCLSLETLKFIHEQLYKNLKEIKITKEALAKYLGRLQFSLEKPDNQISKLNIFSPTPQFFEFEQAGKFPPPTKTEFATASHYIIFQEISVIEAKNEDFLSAHWEKCWYQLLLEVDLSAYNPKENFENGVEESELQKVLNQIYEFPIAFLPNPEMEVKVTLLSLYLSDNFKSMGLEQTYLALENLSTHFSTSLEKILDEQHRVENCLRLLINTLTARNQSMRSQFEICYYERLLSKFAERISMSYTCEYDIVKEQQKIKKAFNLKDGCGTSYVYQYCNYIIENIGA